MSSIAIARDHTVPGQPIMSGRPVRPDVVPAQPTSTGTDPSRPTAAGSVASFAELLVAQIPSEALLAYTTLLALFSVGGPSYNRGRWILYGSAVFTCAVTVVAAYLAKRDYGFQHLAGDAEISATSPKRVWRLTHLPHLPALTAALSMAVYGLTVPGSPLQFELSGPGFGILSGCLAVAGGVMMAIMAPFLGKGNGAVPAAVPAKSAP